MRLAAPRECAVAAGRAGISVALRPVAWIAAALIVTIPVLLFAIFRSFDATPVGLTGRSCCRSTGIIYPLISVTNHELLGRTGHVAFHAIMVANDARIARRDVDSAHDRAVGADALVGIGACGESQGAHAGECHYGEGE